MDKNKIAIEKLTEISVNTKLQSEKIRSEIITLQRLGENEFAQAVIHRKQVCILLDVIHKKTKDILKDFKG